MAKRNRVITFVPIIALATLLAVSLQLNGRIANDVENSSGKENDAIRTALLRKRNYSLCDETALLRHRPFNACAIAKNSSR